MLEFPRPRSHFTGGPPRRDLRGVVSLKGRVPAKITCVARAANGRRQDQVDERIDRRATTAERSESVALRGGGARTGEARQY